MEAASWAVGLAPWARSADTWAFPSPRNACLADVLL